MSHPLPVMFVHGFNGDPGDWTDGGFRQYLLEHGGLDPDLVRIFRYGLAEDGTYNNRGDLRRIAARLAGVGLTDAERLTCSVDQLSADSVARGGPSHVTLIAHSLGGIISRYYLAQAAPDTFGTHYRGNVGRLITIGSPHRGVDTLELTKLAPRNSVAWGFVRLLEKLGLAPALPAQAIDAWETALDQSQREAREKLAEGPLPESRVLLTDSPIPEQLAPDSPLLAGLNQPGSLPANIDAHCVYGDIRLRVRVLLGAGGVSLLDHAVSFGDLAVPARSAREIPGATSTPHEYSTEKLIELTLRFGPAATESRSLAGFFPETQHGRLLSNPEVQDGVLALLND